MTTSDKDEAKRLAETARHSREELEKQGTPDYDPREHLRSVEQHRKVAERLHHQDDES